MSRSFPHLVTAAFLAALAAVLVVLNWQTISSTPEPEAATPPETAATRSQEPIAPLPQSVPQSPEFQAKAKLGQRLFSDPILSDNRTISCASCHPLGQGGMDRRRYSIGVGGALGTTNTPTVFNSGFNFTQFWDGRAATLEDQVGDPVKNPIEMASAWPEVVERLRAEPDYRAHFAGLYPEGITKASISDAIAHFERTLITPDAPFDRYLRGEYDAIDNDARQGYTLFKTYGCASCHQGVNIGGNMFQRFGVLGDYFSARGQVSTADLGRYNTTGHENDRHVFKVPSLRNVALTPPYFHDGSVERLEDAVALMARYQLGRDLSADDNRLIVAFLHTLTGRLNGEPLR